MLRLDINLITILSQEAPAIFKVSTRDSRWIKTQTSVIMKQMTTTKRNQLEPGTQAGLAQAMQMMANSYWKRRQTIIDWIFSTWDGEKNRIPTIIDISELAHVSGEKKQAFVLRLHVRQLPPTPEGWRYLTFILLISSFQNDDANYKECWLSYEWIEFVPPAGVQ